MPMFCEKLAKNGISGKSRVAGSKMAEFSKNDIFCVLHTYYQDLKGVRILPGQKWEMPPTLLTKHIIISPYPREVHL